MTSLQIVEIAQPAELESAYAIRRSVFCDEQKVESDLEFDGLDDACRQYLATWKNQPMGTARLRDAGDGVVKIERVAVLLEARGKGIGKALMERTMEDARCGGAGTIAIHAQCHAEKFYEALGFRRIGGIFEEANIPHIRMELE